MKKLVLASQKGGVGKTTLAAHLAVEAERSGEGPTVLIDTDPQGSLAAWWNSRQSTSPALATTTLTELPAKLIALEKAGFSLVVIDTPPAITNAIRDVVKLADLVLIPTRPSPHDLRAVGSTVDIAKSTGRPFAFAVTQAKPTARLTIQTVAALSAHGAVAPAIIHDRVDYAASMVDGQTVQETSPRSRSAQEITDLFSFVKIKFNDTTRTRKKESV